MAQPVARPRRRGARRAEILRAAGELFQRRGFHQVSMQDVAAAVEITAPALYRHVRGKEELLWAALAAALDGFEAALAPALAEPAPTVDALSRALAAATLDHRALGALMHRETRHLGAERRAEADGRVRHVAEALAAALRRAGVPGEHGFRSWSALYTYGSVSLHGASLPRARFERELAGWGEVLFTTPLTGGGAGAGAERVPEPGPGVPREERPELPGDRRSVTDGQVSGGDGRVSAPPGPPPALSRREELLRVAARLFHERGFEAVSVSEIGAAVGIAGPSVYKHFGGKAEILEAAATRTRDRVRQAMEGALTPPEAPGAPDTPGADAPGAVLLRMLDAYADFAVAHADNLGLISTGSAYLPEPGRREGLAFRREFVGTWTRLLAEARPELDPVSAKITVQAVVTLVNDAVSNPPVRARADLADRLRVLGRALLAV